MAFQNSLQVKPVSNNGKLSASKIVNKSKKFLNSALEVISGESVKELLRKIRYQTH